MVTEKENLSRVMQRIKDILQEEDVAASIVLSTPTVNGDPYKLTTIKYEHLSTSFSFVKVVKSFCCPTHGKREGIVIEASLNGNPEAIRKFQITVGIFIALHKAAARTKIMCESALSRIATEVCDSSMMSDKIKNYTGKANMS